MKGVTSGSAKPKGRSREASSSRRRTICLVGLIAGGHSGVPRYAAKLTEALDRVSGDYPDIALTILTTAAGADAIDVGSINVRVCAGRSRFVNAGPGRLLLEHALVLSTDSDLLHFFDVSGPVVAPGRRFVATIHDTAFMHGVRPVHNAYKRRLYPWALARASALIANSRFTKAEAIRHFGVDPAQVTVVYPGPGLVSPEARAIDEADPKPGFLLYVGNLAPNKNLPSLVRAFHRASVPVRLVLVGRARGAVPELDDTIAAGPARDRIEILDNVSDDGLDRLYRDALALVLPSAYEGFGFTPLEAMARGCPVLASDIPAIREVSGHGAMLLPVGDDRAWAEAITRVVQDDELRSGLRARGAVTVSRYSWERTARGVLDVFARIAA
jgi:glycosyltransferase involved in cell wall biosynthesis